MGSRCPGHNFVYPLLRAVLRLPFSLRAKPGFACAWRKAAAAAPYRQRLVFSGNRPAMTGLSPA
jgi:hypothetical protein